MPRFETPKPIAVGLEFDMGFALIVAGDRADTVVEVLPADETDENDVRAARQTRVDFTGGTLTVKGPRKRSVFGRTGTIRVRVELPAGSRLRASSPMADFVCTGRLGECLIKTSAGDIRVEHADAVNLRTSVGTITLDRVVGDAEISGSGRVDVGELGGAAIVKNLNGETTIGEVAGELRASSSNGRIAVGVARAGVEARSANGGIRVGEVTRGTVNLQTSLGDIEVGIAESTAAWLDVTSRAGGVHNELGPAKGPGEAADTVEVRARTGFGDIVIRRA
ncbi:hypothetical protein E1265_22560 [Streptomyces sp. 8K308]|uniref:DUF4097 family beta strand repeat-containing protein n=1 Tax=Streptomyces sp. 8K308 TaxID=2530388 RepID=UPI001052612C|nr:DUF4097 family beta strand repeat-containing protein [Streptomyces sp. 8K308]TDC20258.1 hypothetical protein E1265_22560 [Streptomyces sp. 8K308]